jgi:hypothetical protein
LIYLQQIYLQFKDKVVEFAKMTPQQLLQATEVAVSSFCVRKMT